MDDLVKEIHHTLEYYKEHAIYAYKQKGMVCHVAEAKDEAGATIRTTWPRANFYQSPLDMEREQGFKDIAGHYKMPKGLKHIELQAYGEVLRHAEMAGLITAEEMNDKFDQLLGALEARNPKIAEIKQSDDKLSRYNTILGIASEYNPKDIQFFLDSFPGVGEYADPKYDKMFMRLTELQIAWLPHPDTLEKLDKQYTQKLAVEAAATVVQESKATQKALPAPRDPS